MSHHELSIRMHSCLDEYIVIVRGCHRAHSIHMVGTAYEATTRDILTQ